MKLISKDSILKNLPPNLNRKEILVLDSLRFLFEMIDSSFENLENRIIELSRQETKRNVPEIFGYAWSIIDNSVRVVNVAKQLPWEYPEQILGHLNYIKEFRNTFQHLDERIDASLLDTQSPFLGVISWTHLNQENGRVKFCQLISGNLIIGPNAKQTIPDLTTSDSELTNIHLHTVNRKVRIQTDLEDLMRNLKKLVIEFETRFKNLVSHDWSKRQDIYIQIIQPS
jgi:hypothetical protein